MILNSQKDNARNEIPTLELNMYVLKEFIHKFDSYKKVSSITIIYMSPSGREKKKSKLRWKIQD